MLRRDLVEREIDAILLNYPELAEDEDLRRDMIEGATEMFEFLTFLVKKSAAAKAAITGTKAWRNEIIERVQRLENRQLFYREVIAKMLERANLDKVQLDIASLRMQAGGARVIITDEKLLPDALCTVVRYPNKKDIAECIKSGGIVPGAELANSPPHLVMSIK